MSIDTARKKDNRDGVHVVTDFISCRLRNPERLSIKQVYNFMKWNIHLEHGRRYPCGFKVSRLYPKYYVHARVATVIQSIDRISHVGDADDAARRRRKNDKRHNAPMLFLD
ncbi:hypothetical protein QR680_007082 [Steinernema hermaphroditum]|uniref:Uncharacterized protein n=1 Tax=Steinernema hermaphroditum TaxID=289476 RepID=A0AA39LYH6_9BILA|nr:hypothetical protein QR680_007082 [Steinernema hermaphroditum]